VLDFSENTGRRRGDAGAPTRGMSTHTGSSTSSRTEELQGSSISLSGNLHPTDSLLHDPPFSTYRRIGIRGFASSLTISRLSNPRDAMVQSTLTSSHLYRDFSYRGFTTCDVMHSGHRSSISDALLLFSFSPPG
jgi:hypothetical protein